MLLAIDVGNTNTVIGMFDGKKGVGFWRIRTVEDTTVDEYRITLRNLAQIGGIEPLSIDGAIISCVVPPLIGALEELCTGALKITPLFVGPGIKTGMPIRYDNPREVGADRIVNAVAAYEKYADELIAVDFGTATTFDYINKAGEYEGGSIAPGVGIAAEALFHQASKLFRVELAAPSRVIAKDTASAIQSGIVFGYASLVDGILLRMFDELGSRPKVIATGGLARVISAEAKLVDIIDDDLTMEGLRILYYRNNPTKKQ
ncbi:MAG: type III pantothenate kinase [Desulfomonile tiedjei]|uniref:Type III pantothenate kinase n=1 Tax=Desulfomonile tiedjei TaxID=2358 RepID=A0A9D6Z8Q6_9BACT|nr:type III pantothenate kinase [Desulfomonile tiedjei]